MVEKYSKFVCQAGVKTKEEFTLFLQETKRILNSSKLPPAHVMDELVQGSSKLGSSSDDFVRFLNAKGANANTLSEITDVAASNRAAFEKYLVELRRDMGKPLASDPKLSKFLEEMYRPRAEIGSGSTAAAIRYELATGGPVKGKEHIQKGQESISYLRKWLNKNSDSASQADLKVAENILLDLMDALGELSKK